MGTVGGNRRGAFGMASGSDWDDLVQGSGKRRVWDDAAATLGLTVTERTSAATNRPTALVGRIGSFSIGFRHVGTDTSSTSFTVGFPPGPWDEHRITVKRGVFGRRLVVRLGEKRGSATHEWVSQFLAADRWEALLDLQDQFREVRLETGIEHADVHSGFFYEETGDAEGKSIVDTVHAMVDCAEVLIIEH